MMKFFFAWMICLSSLVVTSPVMAAPAVKHVYLVGFAAQGSELQCVAQDGSLQVSLLHDGGEETLDVKVAGKTPETFLVIKSDSEQVVAVEDEALKGSPTNRGAVLLLNVYGKSYSAFNGDLVVLNCLK